MSVKEESICKICCNITENELLVIDETSQEMFNVLLLSKNLDTNTNPILCHGCAEVVKRSYYFKSMCINTEQVIVTSVDVKKETTFEMNQIYVGNKDETVHNSGLSICRFCLSHLDGHDFISVEILLKDEMFAEMLPIYMPEMDMKIIKKPVICVLCKDNLECYFKFIQNYLGSKTDEKNTPNFSHDHHSVKHTQMCVIKQEIGTYEKPETIHSGNHEELIDVKQVLNIKDEEDFSCESPIEKYKYSYNNNNIEYMPYDAFSSETNIFKCAMCTYGTNLKHSLNRHMIIHKDATEVEMYKCEKCTYVTKRKKNLEQHNITHKGITEGVTYKCESCTYVAKRKHHLKFHMLIHKDAKDVQMYECAKCTYASNRKENLTQHIVTHQQVTEGEMYKCATCSYKTKRKYNIKHHMVIHGDEADTYKCTTCTFETKRKQNLNKHMLVHRRTSEVDMYKCALCKFETKHKRNLSQHILTHEEAAGKIYKCAMCTIFETKRKDNLKQHMLVHKDVTELDSHKCTICPYEAKRKSHLKQHMLIHNKGVSEVKMFKCQMCSYQTNRKENYKRHMGAMHSGKKKCAVVKAK